MPGVERSSRLQRRQAFLATMPEHYPEEGSYRVRVRLSAELRPNTGFPVLEVSVGYRPDTEILFRTSGVVEITSEEEQVHEFHGRLENHPLPVRGQGKFPGLIWLIGLLDEAVQTARLRVAGELMLLRKTLHTL